LGSENFGLNKDTPSNKFDSDKDETGSFAPVLIGGYPQAGRTLVLDELKALGYEVLDDAVPLEIVRFFSETPGLRRGIKAAAVMRNENGRAPGELENFFDAGKKRFPFKLVFIEAGDAVLIDRLLAFRSISREEARETLEANRASFEPLRSKADLVLNSAYTPPQDEADRINALVEGRRYQAETTVEIMSFGFQYGGESGDLVLDVRFLPNPYYVNSLRPLTGQDKPCADYVFGFEDAQRTLALLEELTETMIRSYREQGRKILKVRIGCTGGQHRSVALAEALGKKLESSGCPVKVLHREMGARRY
jgi:UPF0042 nucleotide-binding protein